MRDFQFKSGIVKEGMCDFCLNGVFWKGKMRDFQVKWGIFEEEVLRFRLNWVFSKPKCVIFTYLGDFPNENA